MQCALSLVSVWWCANFLRLMPSCMLIPEQAAMPIPFIQHHITIKLSHTLLLSQPPLIRAPFLLPRAPCSFAHSQKLNQTDVDGRTLNVVIADPTLRNKERRDREGGGEWQRRAPREPRFGERRYNSGGGGFNDGERSERRDPSTLVVVSNLSFDLTWQELKDAFEDAGLPRPEHVNMKTTPEGRSRGMAIVAMRNAEAAERAIAELSQRELAGRPMVVRRYNVD